MTDNKQQGGELEFTMIQDGNRQRVLMTTGPDYTAKLQQLESTELAILEKLQLEMHKNGNFSPNAIFHAGELAIARMQDAREASHVSDQDQRKTALADQMAEMYRQNGYDVERDVSKETPYGAHQIDLQLSMGGKPLGGVVLGQDSQDKETRAKEDWLSNNQQFTVDHVQLSAIENETARSR